MDNSDIKQILYDSLYSDFMKKNKGAADKGVPQVPQTVVPAPIVPSTPGVPTNQTEIKALNDQLNNAVTEKTNVEAEMRRVKGEMDVLKKKLEDCERNHQTTKETIKSLETQKTKLEADLNSCTDQLKEIESILKPKILAGQTMTDLLNSLIQSKPEVKVETPDAAATQAKLEAEKRELENQLTQIKLELTALEEEIKNLNTKVIEGNTQKEALEQQLSQSRTQQTALENQLAQLNQQLSTCNIDLSSCQGQLSATEEQLQKHQNELKTINEVRQQQAATIGQLEGQLVSTNKQLEDFKFEFGKCNEQRQQQAATIGELEGRLNIITEMIQQLYRANQISEEQYKTLLDKNSQAIQNIAASGNDIVSKIQQDCEERLKRAIAQKDQELQQMKSDLKQCEDEFVVLARFVLEQLGEDKLKSSPVWQGLLQYNPVLQQIQGQTGQLQVDTSGFVTELSSSSNSAASMQVDSPLKIDQAANQQQLEYGGPAGLIEPAASTNSSPVSMDISSAEASPKQAQPTDQQRIEAPESARQPTQTMINSLPDDNTNATLDNTMKNVQGDYSKYATDQFWSLGADTFQTTINKKKKDRPAFEKLKGYYNCDPEQLVIKIRNLTKLIRKHLEDIKVNFNQGKAYYKQQNDKLLLDAFAAVPNLASILETKDANELVKRCDAFQAAIDYMKDKYGYQMVTGQARKIQ